MCGGVPSKSSDSFMGRENGAGEANRTFGAGGEGITNALKSFATTFAFTGVLIERYVIAGERRAAVMMRGGSTTVRSNLASVKLPVVPSRLKKGTGAAGTDAAGATCATGEAIGVFLCRTGCFESCITLIVCDFPHAPKRAYAFLLMGEELAVRRFALSDKTSWL
mmetsp:Transcript_44641/g.71029  ORF Transcript_44641/g.71029 Transcript_44641/m.71029 type:complete len:165 (-) Transcript_44641:141-635(-)